MTLVLGLGGVALKVYLGPWAVTNLQRAGKGSPPLALPWSTAVTSGPGGRASWTLELSVAAIQVPLPSRDHGQKPLLCVIILLALWL